MTMKDFLGRMFYLCFTLSRRQVQQSGEPQSVAETRLRSSNTSRTISEPRSVTIRGSA